jgi:hypothetical protein
MQVHNNASVESTGAELGASLRLANSWGSIDGDTNAPAWCAAIIE